MSKETGGPAFPQSGGFSNEGDPFDSKDMGGAGLTMRDYFAAKAMIIQWHAYDQGYFESEEPNEDMARGAYLMADAMLAARASNH